MFLVVAHEVSNDCSFPMRAQEDYEHSDIIGAYDVGSVERFGKFDTSAIKNHYGRLKDLI